MTSSTGHSGFTLEALPPSVLMASRIAARSTTQGTPVKSCRMTRAGVKLMSWIGSFFRSAPATASTSSVVVFSPSSWRSRFSRRILYE